MTSHGAPGGGRSSPPKGGPAEGESVARRLARDPCSDEGDGALRQGAPVGQEPGDLDQPRVGMAGEELVAAQLGLERAELQGPAD